MAVDGLGKAVDGLAGEADGFLPPRGDEPARRRRVAAVDVLARPPEGPLPPGSMTVAM